MTTRIPGIVATITLAAGLSFAGHTPKAVWIEVDKGDHGKTTIAVTEDVVRAFLKSDGDDIHFNKGKGKKDLITRQMIQDLIDGNRESIEVQDDEDGETAHLYIADLEIPRHDKKVDHVVLETYKHGTRNFRISLGDLEIDNSDDGDDDGSFLMNWRKCLPFLKNSGAALYINNEQEETTVWLYLD